MNREDAIELLEKYVSKPGLRKHCFAVEAVMKHFARIYQADEAEWGLAGLLHDFDYEEFADSHCFAAQRILKEVNAPDWLMHAILAHAWTICTNTKPEGDLELVLFTIDELTGFCVACALVQPDKRIANIDRDFVQRKWKQPKFAMGVRRDIVETGCRLLNREFTWVCEETLAGLKNVAPSIGI